MPWLGNGNGAQKMNPSAIVIALGLLVGAPTASATLMEFHFTADGVTDTVSQQATAVFKFDTDNLGSFTITLTDTVTPTAKIASELDGFEFAFSQAPSSLSLASVSPTSVVDCSQSASPCPDVSSTTSSPYGWGTTLTGADAALGAGFTGDGFGYHPYAIVNSNYEAPGGNGGVSNSQHNPLLVGPVTFTFNVSGLTGVPDISSVMFLFGTVPDSQPGTPCTNGDCTDLTDLTDVTDVTDVTDITDVTVPEPQTLALLGLGLLSVGLLSRRKRIIS
jgi:hypothetical protein